MAFTVLFVALQFAVALTAIILTSKIVGPRLYYYHTRITTHNMDALWSRNVSFVALHPGGIDDMGMGSTGFDSVTASHGNRIMPSHLDSVTLTILPILLVTLWTTMTIFKLPESRQSCSKISPEDSYSHETMQEHATWHILFFGILFVLNAAFVVYVCSPVDLPVVTLVTCILVLAGEIVTLPRGEEEGHTLANFLRSLSLLLMLIVYTFLYSQSRSDTEGVMAAVAVRFFLDMMLIICHTGNGVVMEHIVECRVLYVVCNSILLTSLYACWGRWR